MAVLVFFLLGVWIAALLGLVKGVISVTLSSWRGVNSLCQAVFGAPFTSGGTARWARTHDLRRAHLLTPDGILPLAAWKTATLYEPTGGHVLLCGPPRSGKSWGVVLPVLQHFLGSVIVSDLRGELWAQSHAIREEMGPTWRFAPAEMESCSLNLLDAVRWHTPYAFGDVQRIVGHLLAPTGDPNADAFRAGAVPLLMSIALHLGHSGDGNFPAIVQWMTSPDRALLAKAQELLGVADPLIQSGARRFLDQSDRLRAAVWNAALEPLTIFHSMLKFFVLADLPR
jgi:type IV secretion system protein VirD4